MVKWVNKFKEVGDAAVQYDPGHAALPWAAIRFLLQVSVNDVEMFVSLVEGMEVVCKTIARYAVIEKLYFRQPSSVDKMLEDSIIATYASILRFLSKCHKYFGLGLTRRVARSVTQLPETSVNKHLDRIAKNDIWVSGLTRIVDAERSQLTRTQQLSTKDGIDHLAHDLGQLRTESTGSASKLETLLMSFKEPLIRTIEQASTLSRSLVHDKIESQMKEERLKILTWLSNVQYKKHHQSLSKGLLEGTGSWLLDKPQFFEWRNSSVSSVLWLHGIPGSGKTCLMSTVIRQHQIESSTFENATPIAYFYCQRNTAEPQRSDPTEVLRAILKQLLYYNPLWQKGSPTAKEYRVRKREADEDGSEVSRLDISETTEQIIEIASEMPVTILIDALDECRSSQRHELLEALDDLLERSVQLVKVFVSSRDDVDIVLRLQRHPNIYINVYDNKHDINMFIRAELQKAHSDGRLLKGIASSELKTLITETIARKARGMFLWVSLQIESLCDSRRIKIEGDLVDELDRLPRSLAGMYSLILENISQIEQRGRTVAETILRWLLCTNDARSRVTIAACSGTMTTDHRSLSIPDILDVCSNLVVYDEPLDNFRFAHLSVREFLESQPGYSPSEANMYVLERSLQKVVYDQPSGDPSWSYASLNWISHYTRLKEQHLKEVFELHAKRFLFDGAESSDIFNTWATEAYRQNRDLPRSEPFYSPLEFIHSNNLYTEEANFLSPIKLASRFGWLEVLDYFETNQSPADFHGSAREIMTIAIEFDQTTVVRWLFDRDFGSTDEHLNLAFDFRRSEIIQLFLNMNGLSLNAWGYGRKVLVLAVRLRLGEIYEDPINKGANINCRDQNGHTLPSHAVSSSNNSGIIENPPKFRDCKDVLWCALQSSYFHTACLLLHYGPDSVLENVAMRAEWMDLLTFITTFPGLEYDMSASLAKRSEKLVKNPGDRLQLISQTLLSLAALFRHEEAFQVLLDWGIDPSCPAMCEIRNKVSTIAQMGRSICRQEALDPKSLSNNNNKMSDELRQGPLAWAAYTGNLSLVQSILGRGMEPNLKNRKGQTALYFAVQQTKDWYSRIDLETKKEAIVRLLLRKGALVTSADTYGGATLLAHAFKAGYSKVAKLLLENGAEIPKSAIAGPMEHLWGAFDQGQEGIRQAILERIRGAQVDSLDLQPAILDVRWSGDTLGIATRLIWGGTMRVLGDMILTASSDVE